MGEVTTPLLSRRTYIVGYSGYIPGLMFRYGQTFGRAAEESITQYIKLQAERKAREEVKRSRSLPRIKEKRSDSQVIQDFYNKYGLGILGLKCPFRKYPQRAPYLTSDPAVTAHTQNCQKHLITRRREYFRKRIYKVNFTVLAK
ncbi:uncharacterized protein LOC119590330 [Penaeus monodon]|uniref:uncharacterized protein LOC119590330 n=1 Tax=Penaeus monodon TaxID=6687 RepID=UPI0018A721D9|nr:uncharacterized protein LOC119590330 [Penaeus monodon]